MPKACTQQSTHSANMVSEDQEKVLQEQTARQYCTGVRGTVQWPKQSCCHSPCVVFKRQRKQLGWQIHIWCSNTAADYVVRHYGSCKARRYLSFLSQQWLKFRDCNHIKAPVVEVAGLGMYESSNKYHNSPRQRISAPRSWICSGI